MFGGGAFRERSAKRMNLVRRAGWGWVKTKPPSRPKRGLGDDDGYPPTLPLPSDFPTFYLYTISVGLGMRWESNLERQERRNREARLLVEAAGWDLSGDTVVERRSDRAGGCGTRTQYVHRKCRCERCRAAEARYQRDRRRSARRGVG